MKIFLQLIRYKNLSMLAFVQILFPLTIALQKDISLTNPLLLILWIQSTVFLAAAGNVINDFMDVKADQINKPKKVLVGTKFSKNSTLQIYYILNFFGIISGITLAYLHGKIIYGFLFIGISAMLYLYSKSYKHVAILGNIIVSLLIALSILLLLIFPPFDTTLLLKQNTSIIITYSIFAFLINLIREIVKDIEDVDGDYLQNSKSLPIIIGRKRTQSIVLTISFIPLLLLIGIVYFIQNLLISSYFILFTILPLGYFMYQIKKTKSKKGFHNLSTILKLIMLFGIFSIIFLKYYPI